MALPCIRNDPTVLQIRSNLDHFCRQEPDDIHLPGLASKSISHRATRQKCRRFSELGARLSLFRR